jgi:hypothetical protein
VLGPAGDRALRQPHRFLALGRQVLLDRSPDVLDHVLGLGARENRQYELLPAEAQEGDERFVSICARRPLLEYALRRAVEAEDSVALATSTRVVGLLADSDRLLDAAHQQLRGPLVLVWDNLNTHTSRAMRELITARSWLTVYQLPPDASELNPVGACG